MNILKVETVILGSLSANVNSGATARGVQERDASQPEMSRKITEKKTLGSRKMSKDLLSKKKKKKLVPGWRSSTYQG